MNNKERNSAYFVDLFKVLSHKNIKILTPIQTQYSNGAQLETRKNNME